MSTRINTITLKSWKAENFPENITKLCEDSLEVLLTGSKYICPTEHNKDIDIMLLVSSTNTFTIKHLSCFEKCGNIYADDIMHAYRSGDYNILITHDSNYFKKWALATHIATLLNLTSKCHRSILFDHLLTDYDVKRDVYKDFLL